MSTFYQDRNFAKADVYRLLSACYYQPEAAFLDENVFGQLAIALTIAASPSAPEGSRLGDDFRSAGVETLLLDYSRLFLGPFGVLAKPYGSIYLDSGKQVMDASTIAACELYQEGGFDVDESFREAPDHVAVELEFLYLLTHRIATASASGDMAERDRLAAVKRRFLDGHLGQWVGSFADNVEQGAETAFYRRLASLTCNFVREDRKESEAA